MTQSFLQGVPVNHQKSELALGHYVPSTAPNWEMGSNVQNGEDRYRQRLERRSQSSWSLLTLRSDACWGFEAFLAEA